MKLIPALLWALLLAAPVSSQQALWSDPQLSTEGPKWFQLVENESEVRFYPWLAEDFAAVK